jgi:DNA polymerase-1
MRYLTFGQVEQSSYPVCILTTSLRRDGLLDGYFRDGLLGLDDAFAIELHQGPGKKTPAAEIKAYIEEMLVPAWNQAGVSYLLVTDSDYFKILTKQTKVDVHLGYVLDCVYGPWKVVYAPTHRQIFYDPDKIRTRIQTAIRAIADHAAGTYTPPGNEVIKEAYYPMTPAEVAPWLKRFLCEKVDLTADIEGFSLRHTTAGIGTISFAWSKHDGIAFPVDLSDDPEGMRTLLRDFFEAYAKTGATMTWHSIGYDVTVLIYQLFMKDILDTAGLLYGIEVMLGSPGSWHWDCTKLITYLATNSCSGNKLGLKHQAHEFAGNYALDDEEIRDIRKIPLPDLLRYNLVDALSTWFVKEKHEPTMIADQQQPVYEDLFKPSQVDIIQMQLTGMPVNMEQAKKVSAELDAEKDRLLSAIIANPIVQTYTSGVLNVQHAAKRNEKLKKKQIAPGDEPQTFNPNSDIQVRGLLFDFLGLPVINLTESKLPSTDGETIEALLNQEQVSTQPELKQLLEDLQVFTIVGTLTTNFMPSILAAEEGPDGWHYLFGNFNLGGTLSGRLSSSSPNLQNIPSTGKGHKIKLRYAKMIKSCFEAPPGWLFVGADFPSLEDRISAVTTKDPNKLKVYIDGYDSHSLRSYSYWPEKMPDIDPTSVESINSIAKKYKPIRDRSKNPSFTLTYQGTYIALVKKYGFETEEAKRIEAKYHELYKVSDEWVFDKLDQASRKGYVEIAFGLRLRTPLLHQVVRGTSKTPYEAEAEGRTAGNALGQSWCLLNSRAWNEFMADVRSSKHRLDIRPCAQIHDAGYALIRDDLEVIRYTNDRLPKAMAWQDHPVIWHDEVKLAGAELEIFYPNWNHPITLPNGASEEEIIRIVGEATS